MATNGCSGLAPDEQCDLTQRMQELVELLHALGEHHPVRLRPVGDNAVPIVFYLDDPKTTEWAPILGGILASIDPYFKRTLEFPD